MGPKTTPAALSLPMMRGHCQLSSCAGRCHARQASKSSLWYASRHSTIYFLDLFSLCSFMLTLVSSFTSRTACVHNAQGCKPQQNASRPLAVHSVPL